MTYTEQQRQHHISLAQNTDIFNNTPAGVIFRNTARPYILIDSTHNLHESCRQQALDYFAANGISWWQLEQAAKSPTGHLLSSQIACINHLFPIRNNKEAVVQLLKTIDPDFSDVAIIESDTPETQGYIAFEAVCAGNYLNENNFTRGANATSVDALIIGKKADGKNILVTIEWKYTESYSVGEKSDKSRNRSGEIRRARYDKLIADSKYLKNSYTEVYYFEPFYQLMRQTLFAEQMVANNYTGCTSFINIHVIPAGNKELLKPGKHKYSINGRVGSLKELWTEQLECPGMYKTISPEELLATQPEPCEWKDYLRVRYWQ